MTREKSDGRGCSPGHSQQPVTDCQPRNEAGEAKGQEFYIDRLLVSSGRANRGELAPHIMRAGQIRNELARLAAARRLHGELLPDGVTAHILARIAVTKAGRRWTIDDIRDIARHAEIPMPAENIAVREARRAAEEQRLGVASLLPSTDVLGDMLAVTGEEHVACKLRAIGIACQTVEARRQRKDRDRKKVERAAKGAVPRVNSLSATRPWKAEGISRRTWERRRDATEIEAADANASARNYMKDSNVDEFASSDPNGLKLRGNMRRVERSAEPSPPTRKTEAQADLLARAARILDPTLAQLAA